MNRQRDALNVRMEQIEARYRRQFTALDSLISSMNTTSTFLTQQLASLPTYSS
jgi:flagellar hook-associated protein 2